MHLAVKTTADDAEVADFVLYNNRLRGTAGTLKTRYLKEAAGGRADGAESGIIVPWGAEFKGDFADPDVDGYVAGFYPS